MNTRIFAGAALALCLTVSAWAGEPTALPQAQAKKSAAARHAGAGAGAASKKSADDNTADAADSKATDPFADSKASEASLYFMRLYASICVQAGAQSPLIKDFFNKKGVTPLADSEAAPFLLGHHGTAWLASAPFGVYVVAARDDGLCAVFARKANTTEIETLFRGFVEKMPVEAPYRILRNPAESNWQGNVSAYYQSYQMGIPGDSQSFHFTLTTSDSDAILAQAMVTFSRIATGIP